MIDYVIEFSIRRRWLVVAASCIVALLGAWAVRQTPIDAVPELSENQVLVFTEWAGKGPREIEDQVTGPLVKALQGISGLRVVRGSSDVGYSMIHLIFDDHVPLQTSRARPRAARAGPTASAFGRGGQVGR
jgi:Cu(I)/Ag(I) efflux system membrane protein CusA/SilA